MWLRVLLGGSAVYALVTAAVLDTDNINLVPLVLLLGASLIPVTFVAYILERLAIRSTLLPALATCFGVGGSLGVAAASVLEYQTLHDLGTLPMVAVGLIEETVKLLVPFFFFVRGRFRGVTDGVLLGVAAGMGFAVMESMGYGLVALIQSHGRIGPAEQLLLLRGLASPVGHAAWTGLICAALWNTRIRTRRARAWAALAASFCAAVALHALWDTTDSTLVRTGIGLLSGALLVARIRRARTLDYARSRTRGIDSPADDSAAPLAHHGRAMRRDSASSGPFDRLAERATDIASRGVFFAACLLLVVAWAPTLLWIGNVNTWQLVINTATTIVTFLLVALLQNCARRSDRATHRKLDALADGLADLMDFQVNVDARDLQRDINDLKHAVGLEQLPPRLRKGHGAEHNGATANGDPNVISTEGSRQ